MIEISSKKPYILLIYNEIIDEYWNAKLFAKLTPVFHS